MQVVWYNRLNKIPIRLKICLLNRFLFKTLAKNITF